MEQNFKRYFSPSEANAMLPLVKKIVADILHSGNKIRHLTESLDYPELKNSDKLKQVSHEIETFMDELTELGCFYKDWSFNIGLVDFPSIIDGQEVFLCWKSDEDSITFYHSFEAGFAGRKTIPAKYL